MGKKEKEKRTEENKKLLLAASIEGKISKIGEWLLSGQSLGDVTPKDMKYVLK